MIRICGLEVPSNKAIVYSLTYIKGIGITTAKNICISLGLSMTQIAKGLDDAMIQRIESHIKEIGIPIDDDVQRNEYKYIRRLISIGSWRGSRHSKKLSQHGSGRSRNKTVKKRGSIYGQK